MSTPTVTTGPLRRVPVQGRSVARVQRMLDACAELVDDVGYEGLTTTLLAERAEQLGGSTRPYALQAAIACEIAFVICELHGPDAERPKCIDPARIALGLATSAYTDGSPVAGVTPVRAIHIEELRGRLK